MLKQGAQGRKGGIRRIFSTVQPPAKRETLSLFPEGEGKRIASPPGRFATRFPPPFVPEKWRVGRRSEAEPGEGRSLASFTLIKSRE